MIEIRGNLWNQNADAVVITTNGFVKSNGACVMGRGCAKEARDKFPGIDKRLGGYIKTFGNRPFVLIHEREHADSFNLVTMPVKHNWWEPADIALIIESAEHLVRMADKFAWNSVIVPRPGCGNGQLNWEDVRAYIAPILDDRFTVITF